MNQIEEVNKMSKYDSEYILGSEDEAYSDDEDEEEQPKTKERASKEQRGAKWGKVKGQRPKVRP
jgi:hypothetical protein